MKIVLVTLAALFSLAAVAAPSTSKPAYKQFFLVNGKESDAETAIIASLRGQETFKCTSVAASVSKSGTSIGVKAVKKPAKQSTASN